MDFGVVLNAAALLLSVVALVLATVLTYRQLVIARRSNLTLVTIELLTREPRTEEFLESEDYVLHKLAAEHPADNGVGGLPLNARKHVVRIGLFYAGIGMMSVFKVVDNKLLATVLGFRAQRVWTVLRPYILREREIRKGPFLGYFEHLICVVGETDLMVLRKSLGMRQLPDVEPEVDVPASGA